MCIASPASVVCYGCSFTFTSTGSNSAQTNKSYYTIESQGSLSLRSSTKSASRPTKITTNYEASYISLFIFYLAVSTSSISLSTLGGDVAPLTCEVYGKCKYFVYAQNGGDFSVQSSINFTAEENYIGTKFRLLSKASINVAGRGESFLPGNTAGSIAANQYCLYI